MNDDFLHTHTRAHTVRCLQVPVEQLIFPHFALAEHSLVIYKDYKLLFGMQWHGTISQHLMLWTFMKFRAIENQTKERAKR